MALVSNSTLDFVFNDLVTTDGQQVITTVRMSDGYLDGTRMCKSGGKEVKEYLKTKSARAFMNEVSKDSLIKEQLFIIQLTGPNELRGTFVHPTIAIHLAFWISPRFVLAVIKFFQNNLISVITPNNLQPIPKETKKLFLYAFDIEPDRQDPKKYKIGITTELEDQCELFRAVAPFGEMAIVEEVEEKGKKDELIAKLRGYLIGREVFHTSLATIQSMIAEIK